MKKPRSISGYNHMVVNSLWILLLFFAILAAGSCKKKNPNPDCPVLPAGSGLEVVSHTERDSEDVVDYLALLPDDPANFFDYQDFYTQTTTGLPGGILPFPIAHEVVKYTSTDNNGNKIQLSGLLIYPYYFPPVTRVSAPIVSVNHGTQLMKDMAPSKWKSAKWSDWKYYPEMVIADAMAVWYGWIIIMPDYQGMGDDITENHPYCVNNRLATATADMVVAAQNSLSCNRNDYVKWNGQTYLYGFSEGGFVTMAAARELENRNVSLSGVVCMDGPYDLSGTMLDVMLSDNPFPVPYFLPMLMVGYNTMYPETYDYELMLKEPYKTDIPEYTNGFYNDSVVNSKMPPDKILKKIFTDAFYDSLKNFNSKAFQVLYENNAYINWAPKSKMLLWHCQNDDCVPFGNFVTAKQRFTELGLSNVEYVEWPPVELNPDRKTVHVTVAPRAFYEGSRWIYHKTK